MTAPATLLGEIPVIDTDAHIIEPPDLWSARMPKKWVDRAPKPATDENGQTRWRVGDTWLSTVGFYGWAGWRDFMPNMPAEYSDLEPGALHSKERLTRMDDLGIWAQVLYPNIVGFESATIMKLDPPLALACIRTYNDWLIEYCEADPKRFIPIAMVPFWDIDAAVQEMRRCVDLGHRGILFGNRYESVGLPVFTERHWDPIYAAAQEMDLAVNFHVAFQATAETAAGFMRSSMRNFDGRQSALGTSLSLMSNYETIARLVCSDVCERFPRLNFVSVESGFGYVPYLLEVLDWHWKGYGVVRDRPMLPSEYFRRQVYGSLWFETTTLPLLEVYPDNFMFETDYPHPTSLSPGPASHADRPSDHIQKNWQKVPLEIARKVLHENAARVYRWNG